MFFLCLCAAKSSQPRAPLREAKRRAVFPGQENNKVTWPRVTAKMASAVEISVEAIGEHKVQEITFDGQEVFVQ